LGFDSVATSTVIFFPNFQGIEATEEEWEHRELVRAKAQTRLNLVFFNGFGHGFGRNGHETRVTESWTEILTIQISSDGVCVCFPVCVCLADFVLFVWLFGWVVRCLRWKKIKIC